MIRLLLAPFASRREALSGPPGSTPPFAFLRFFRLSAVLAPAGPAQKMGHHFGKMLPSAPGEQSQAVPRSSLTAAQYDREIRFYLLCQLRILAAFFDFVAVLLQVEPSGGRCAGHDDNGSQTRFFASEDPLIGWGPEFAPEVSPDPLSFPAVLPARQPAAPSRHSCKPVGATPPVVALLKTGRNGGLPLRTAVKPGQVAGRISWGEICVGKAYYCGEIGP